MGKSLYIAEKPSVAQQFADALKISARRSDGYIESDTAGGDLVRGTSGYHELSGGI